MNSSELVALARLGFQAGHAAVAGRPLTPPPAREAPRKDPRVVEVEPGEDRIEKAARGLDL